MIRKCADCLVELVANLDIEIADLRFCGFFDTPEPQNFLKPFGRCQEVPDCRRNITGVDLFGCQ